MIYKKGFTLIELLVVISIIATLASVVLAALSGTRVKAVNARIIQEAQQLRNQIELSRAVNGSYPYLMGSTGTIIAGNTYVLARRQELGAATNLTPLINDILDKNGSSWPTGYGGPNNGSAAGCQEAYNLTSGAGNAGDIANKLRIFVNTNACTAGVSSAATAYAIYVNLMPSTGTGSGYYCIDWSGRTTKSSTGTGFTPNTPTTPTTCQ